MCAVGMQSKDKHGPGFAMQPTRSNIVTKEIEIDDRVQLLAATPPLDFIGYFTSRCASRQRWARPSRFMMQDSSNANLFSLAARDIYIDSFPEEAEPGMVGKPGKPLYGTIGFALNGAETYTSVLLSKGFKKGRGSQCTFFH